MIDYLDEILFESDKNWFLIWYMGLINAPLIMVVMIWRYCVLIMVVLLLMLSKVLIIIVLFTTFSISNANNLLEDILLHDQGHI